MSAFAPRFMDSVGDGSGSINMNVDGSITPQIFRVTPQPGEILYINRMIVYVQDSGTMDSGGFGNGPALTNGIEFKFMYDVGEATEGSYPDPTFQPIKINTHWQSYAHDISLSTWGSGDQSYSMRYTFVKDSPGNPPWVADSRKEEFWVVINDDLTVLTDMRVRLGISADN
jgi:hypothetical protein